MTRTIIYSAITLILIVLGVGMSQGWFSGTEHISATSTIDRSAMALTQAAQVSADTPSINATPSLSSNPADSNSIAGVRSSHDAESIKSTKAVTVSEVNRERSPDADLHGEPISSNTNEPSSNTSEPLDNSVVGRPIPISASVELDCKKQIEQRGDGTPCAKLLPLLSRMAQEPRDITWASAMEALLRDYVLTSSEEFTIRSLECRQSLCTAEIASLYGMLPIDDRWNSNKPLIQSLLPSTAYIGIEPDPSGNGAVYGTKLTVTVETFKRRNFETKQATP